jgi:hypothetical protein
MANKRNVKGFPEQNLERIRRWDGFWSIKPELAKQAASQLLAIPWHHHLVAIDKCQWCG